MNIACTACSARYGVADEKLVGKRVRITCKRCGTVLIVDGNYNPPTVSASTSIPPSPPASSRPPVESRRPAPPPEPPFTVAFADGRQEQADVAQIVRFHRAGQLGTDSVVWREGMADWADPWDVPEIAAAFRRMGYGRPTPAPSFAPRAQPLHEPVEEEATQIHRSSPQHVAPAYGDSEDTHVTDSSRRGATAARRDQRVAARHVVEDDEVPTQVGLPAQTSARRASQSPQPQRARRVSSQPAPRESAAEEYQRARREAKALSSARARSSRPPVHPSQPAPDMFARQSRAGSEEEQVEQAGLGAAHDVDGPRLTGARNESSVLFSLDTLIKQDQQKKSAPPPAPRRRDESFLVDSGGALPVGGGIAPALAAPDFTAPVSVAPPAPKYAEPLTFEDTGRTRSRAWVYVAALVVFGGGGALAWKSGALDPLLVKLGVSAPPVPAVPVPSSTATAEPTARPAESATAAASASATAEASASASASPPAAATATPPSPAHATGAAPVARASQSSSSKQSSSSTKESSSTAKEPSSSDNDATPKESAPKETTAKEAASAPFDPAAAKEALAGATANVASCKEMGGPTGNGRVSITFAPSGRPTSVAVTGDLAGTTVGSCIARLYRAVRVPAFSGDPVTVAKGFSVE